MANAVFCLATSYGQAEQLVNALKQAGFAYRDISVLFPDKRGSRDFAHEQLTKAPEGAVSGLSLGGLLGGSLGWLVAIGALTIPGAGPLIAGGPILAALSSATVGATIGGVGGALIGRRIPEFEARRYAGKLAAGNILVSVHAHDADSQSRACELCSHCGALHIKVMREKRLTQSQRASEKTARLRTAASAPHPARHLNTLRK